eukprot:UN03216
MSCLFIGAPWTPLFYYKKGFTSTCVLGLNKVQLPLSYITHFCVSRSYCQHIPSGMECPVLSRKLRPSGGLA